MPPPIKKNKQIDPLHAATKTKSQKKSKGLKITVWLFSILCFLALFFSISMIFTSATVKVTPRSEIIDLNNKVYTAALKTNAAQDLPFEVISIDKDIFKTEEATGEKHVELRAVGEVTIFNSYSTTEQKLSSGTRLAFDDGRIYRTDSPVTIPGLKNTNGKDIPGSVVVSITADKAGDKYNIKNSDSPANLKIVGFKGSDKYNSFYATVNGEIAGGFIGQKKTITPEKEQQLTSELQNDLKNTLLADLKNKVPENYVSLNNLNYINYSPLLQENDGDQVKIGMRASLNAIIFSKGKLAYYLAEKNITNFNRLAVEIIVPDGFTITMTSTSTTPWLEKNVDFSFNGNPTIKWKYKSEDLKADLVGQNGLKLSEVKAKNKETISDISVRFNLFWQVFFPDDISRIKIEE